MRSSGRSVRPRRGAAGLLVALTVAGMVAAPLLGVPTPAAAAGGFDTEDLRVESGSGADAVELDVTIFTPQAATESEPAASIVIPHGYGATKEQSRGQATKFAREGYVVVTYTARGFGETGGQISLNAPDYEVADARQLIDLLGDRSEVQQDAEGDPRVGFFGGSYGGGLSLMVAGYDERVDAVVASRTWNSLVNSLFPNAAGAPAAATPAAPGGSDAASGVFKKEWAEYFFEGGSLDADGGGGGGGQPSGEGCGGLRPEYCSAYDAVREDNQLTDEMRDLLAASSPASVIDRITAPTLLTQGEGDKLFPLSEADANARGIAANGTPVKLAWITGGHGALRSLPAESAQLDVLVSQWFDFHLRGTGTDPGTSFDYTEVTAVAQNGRVDGEPATIETYPGLTGPAVDRLEIPLNGAPQEMAYPEGGDPAAFSSLPPGVLPASGDRRQPPTDVPGQIATFETDSLVSALEVVGSPVVDLRLASPTGEAVIFGKIFDVDAEGAATLVQGLVAPARFVDLPESLDGGAEIAVTLPAIAHRFVEGHQLRVVLSSTDQGFATPDEATVYQVALRQDAAGTLALPNLTGSPAPEFTPAPPPAADGSNRTWLIVGVVVVGLGVVILGVLVALRRRSPAPRW